MTTFMASSPGRYAAFKAQDLSHVSTLPHPLQTRGGKFTNNNQTFDQHQPALSNKKYVQIVLQASVDRKTDCQIMTTFRRALANLKLSSLPSTSNDVIHLDPQATQPTPPYGAHTDKIFNRLEFHLMFALIIAFGAHQTHVMCIAHCKGKMMWGKENPARLGGGRAILA